MESDYVILLNFLKGTLDIIHLTEEEIEESRSYEYFEEYLITLEDKYDFRLSSCQWMVTDKLKIRYNAELGLHSI